MNPQFNIRCPNCDSSEPKDIIAIRLVARDLRVVLYEYTGDFKCVVCDTTFRAVLNKREYWFIADERIGIANPSDRLPQPDKIEDYTLRANRRVPRYKRNRQTDVRDSIESSRDDRPITD
jgi:hypothetical protein